jgi:CheY-like chemotaxis protein
MVKALIVDDSLSVRRVVQWILETRDMRVVTASTVAEALEAVAREQPQLVVTDVHLGDREGHEVCRAVRADARLATTPVVVMSGRVDDDLQRRAFQAGADLVLRKPFAPEDLLRQVDEIVARRAALAAAPSPPPAPPVAPPAAPASAPAPRRDATTEPPDLKRCLDRLVTASGVQLAVMTDRQGFLVETAGQLDTDADLLGAMASCLAQASAELGERLGQGASRGLTVEHERGLALVHPVNHAAILTVVLSDPAELAKARYHVQRVLPDLARAL